MIVVDREMSVTKWNRAAQQLFRVDRLSDGTCRADCARWISDLRAPSKISDRTWASLGSRPRVIRGRKDGTHSPSVRGRAAARSQGHAVRYIGVYTDLTDVGLLEETSTVAEDGAIGTLAGGIAHDFNKF